MLLTVALLTASAQDAGGLEDPADAPADPTDAPADPTDRPHMVVRALGAVALNPGGIILDGGVAVRLPILRYGGAVFNDTFAGAGLRVALSPVHFDLALRGAFKPLDLLPIAAEVGYSSYWRSPWGVVPMDSVTGQLQQQRLPLYQAERDFAATAIYAAISPTLQLKFGKIAAFTNLTFTLLRVRPTVQDGDEPWIFEPYRGMVISPDEQLFEHTSAIVFDPHSGVNSSIIRVGPVLRGRTAATTHDTTLQIGGLAQWRPGRKPHDPDFTVLVAPYLQDSDFSVGSPFFALLIGFSRVVPIKRTPL